MAAFKRILGKLENQKFRIRVFDMVDSYYTSSDYEDLCLQFIGEVVQIRELKDNGLSIGYNLVKCKILQNRLITTSGIEVDLFSRLIDLDYYGFDADANYIFRPLYLELFDKTATTSRYFKVKTNQIRPEISGSSLIFELSFTDGFDDFKYLLTADYASAMFTDTVSFKLSEYIENCLSLNESALAYPGWGSNTLNLTHFWEFQSIGDTGNLFEKIYTNGLSIFQNFNNFDQFLSMVMVNFYCSIYSEGLGVWYLKPFENGSPISLPFQLGFEGMVLSQDDPPVGYVIPECTDKWSGINKVRCSTAGPFVKPAPGFMNPSEKIIPISFMEGYYTDGHHLTNLFSYQGLYDLVNGFRTGSSGSWFSIHDILRNYCFDRLKKGQLVFETNLPTIFTGMIDMGSLYSAVIEGRNFTLKPVKIERSLTGFTERVKWISIKH